MKLRPFGRTGIEVSEIVFGGGWVGGLIIDQDDETRRAAIRRALGAGINWIDTAPSYGEGKSEAALGWLLQEVGTAPHISTKVRLNTGRLDDIAGQVERSLADSLSRLRRERVDLVFLHNPIAAEADANRVGIADVLGAGGVLDALDVLRAEGLFRFVGITALGEVAAVREVIDSGRLDAAQVYYNMLNPSAGEAMPPNWSGQDLSGVIAACRRQGAAVMNIRTFAAGVLATKERTGREIIITEDTLLGEEERKARAVFDALGERYGTPAQTAIRFSLANPDVACVAVGVAELSHLEEAIAAAETGPLPAAALAQLRALYGSDFRQL